MASSFRFGANGARIGSSPVRAARVEIPPPLHRRLFGEVLGFDLASASITGLLRNKFPSGRSSLFDHAALGHYSRFSQSRAIRLGDGAGCYFSRLCLGTLVCGCRNFSSQLAFSEGADSVHRRSTTRRVHCFACACILLCFLPYVDLQRPSRETHTTIRSVVGGPLVLLFFVEPGDCVSETAQSSQLLLTGVASVRCLFAFLRDDK
jgi:hypothetical protein